MEKEERRVDGFRFLPPGLAAWVRTFIPKEDFSGPIPWTPVPKPLKELSISLVTSAGISLKSDRPFDMEREKREPLWGDPTSRFLPKETTEKDIQVHHLHINTKYILQDINVMLPVGRMAELEKVGVIGRLAPTAYSFYGFQWEGDAFLETAIAPMAGKMKEEGVEAVLLTPA
jgi:D-proline reductase (dithiol) PrdB